MKTNLHNNQESSGENELNQSNNDIEELIVRLKKRDADQKKTYRRFSILLFVMVFVYLALMVINPDPELKFSQRISGICYVLAFLAGAWLFRKENRTMAQINYSDPVLKVMMDALQRYRFFKKSFWRFLLVPLLINIGISISGPARYMPDEWTPVMRFLILQLIYWSFIFISGIIGYIIWKKRSKPYRDAVTELIRELN